MAKGFMYDDPTAAYAEAQRRIQQAASDNSTTLDLLSIGLTSVPPEIWQLTKLTALHLFNNQLTRVPPEIGQFTKLTKLYLFGNELTSVPPEIGQLTKLTSLDLSANQLASVPPEIGQLTKLTELYLHSNQLTSVPPEIGQLTQLTELYLNGNQLTSVPPEIGQLTKLTTLYLSLNQLTSVPPEIGQLSKLTELVLDNNQLTALPESLRRLPKLEALYLHNNPQLDLPASVLGVSFNEWINSDHKKKDAPKPGPILDYYFRTRQPAERQPLREGKLILVGRGDVGKTSLVRRLVENTFSRREDTTQGIRIRPWDVGVRKNETIRMHAWDFGGQEIMHATHQLFLTDRSLYLLVLDGRGGQQEAEADYWLRLIASFAPESPVLVVLNKIKKDPFDLNRRALREKFPQVHDFLETDCDHPGRNEKPGQTGFGIEKLRKAITKQVDKLPEIRQPFPASWFDIKEKLSRAEKLSVHRRVPQAVPQTWRARRTVAGSLEPVPASAGDRAQLQRRPAAARPPRAQPPLADARHLHAAELEAARRAQR